MVAQDIRLNATLSRHRFDGETVVSQSCFEYLMIGLTNGVIASSRPVLQSWCVVRHHGSAAGSTLTPRFSHADQTGRDPSKWFLVGWLYNGIYYTSTDDFRAAWKKADFVKAATRNEPGDWFSSDRVGPELKYDERAPPMQVQPDGQRFAVDAGEKYVEWST